MAREQNYLVHWKYQSQSGTHLDYSELAKAGDLTQLARDLSWLVGYHQVTADAIESVELVTKVQPVTEQVKSMLASNSKNIQEFYTQETHEEETKKIIRAALENCREGRRDNKQCSLKSTGGT